MLSCNQNNNQNPKFEASQGDERRKRLRVDVSISSTMAMHAKSVQASATLFRFKTVCIHVASFLFTHPLGFGVSSVDRLVILLFEVLQL